MKEKNIIDLKNIVVEFEDERVLKGIDLSIRDKEFVTLLGPSGCGKTTTLRIIAGFVQPAEGEVLFEGEKINGVPPHKRQVNTIFQRYALFPHLNVYENVAFGLRIKKTPEKEIRKRVREMLELVGLKGYEKRSVNKLSGGQQQRVAIARAVINHPRVLLLDEPLAALDLKLRKDMQVELKKIQQSLGITFLYVTHDQEEALTMSDRVVVMNNGEIQQIGTPQDIYNEPQNAFVADFIGESNIIEGVMLADYSVRFAGRDFECVDAGFGQNKPVDVVVRPEDVQLVKPEQGHIRGIAESSVFKGVHYEIIADADGYKWMIHSTKDRAVGEEIGMRIDPEDIHIMRKMSNTFDAYTAKGGQIEFAGTFADYPGLTLDEDTVFTVVIHPEDVKLVAPGEGIVDGIVDECWFKGLYYEITVIAAEYEWTILSDREVSQGERVGLSIATEDIHLDNLPEGATGGGAND